MFLMRNFIVEKFQGGSLGISFSCILPQNILKLNNFLVEDQHFWHKLIFIKFIGFYFFRIYDHIRWQARLDVDYEVSRGLREKKN